MGDAVVVCATDSRDVLGIIGDSRWRGLGWGDGEGDLCLIALVGRVGGGGQGDIKHIHWQGDAGSVAHEGVAVASVTGDRAVHGYISASGDGEGFGVLAGHKGDGLGASGGDATSDGVGNISGIAKLRPTTLDGVGGGLTDEDAAVAIESQHWWAFIIGDIDSGVGGVGNAINMHSDTDIKVEVGLVVVLVLAGLEIGETTTGVNKVVVDARFGSAIAG